MSNMGWIKLHRKIQECSLWADDEPFDRRSAWVDLLLLVNHEPKRILVDGKGKTIETGQRLTSTLKLAERWRWSVPRVRRFLTLLEEEQMITTERTPRGTVLTIVNYGVFQGSEMGSVTTDVTTDVIADVTTDVTTHVTTDVTADVIQTRSKELKNEKNDKNEKKIKRVFFPNDEALNSAFADYVDTRKKIKSPMTDKAIDLAISKLMKLSNGDNDTAIEILNNSIVNGWKGLYPLKETKQETKTTSIEKMWEAI